MYLDLLIYLLEVYLGIQDISIRGVSMYADSSIESIPIVLRYINTRNILELRS